MRSSVSGSPLRTLVLLLVLALTLSALSACQSDDEGAQKKEQTSRTVVVSPDAAATAAFGDLAVTVPGGGVSQHGKLTLSQRTETGAPVPANMAGTLAATTPEVSVDLASTSLVGRATIRREVPATWRDNWVPVWVWQDHKGGWQWLPTAVEADGGRQIATATTGHFSEGFLAAFDAGAAARRVSADLAGFFTGRANQPNPTCDGEDDASKNVTVTSDNGDAVKWCLGMADGYPVLKVTNNRRTFAEIVTTTNVEVIDGAQYGISIENLLRVSGEFLAKFASRFPSDRSVYLLKAGATMTFRVPSDESGVELSGSGVGFLLQIMLRAADLYGTVSKAAGLTATTTGERLFNLLGTGEGTNKDWAWTTFGCLNSFASEFTDDLSRPASALDDLGHALSFAANCGLEIGAASISASGPLAWLVSATAATVATVGGAVIGLVEALFMAAREVGDAIARGFGSKNDPIYTIRTRSKTSALPKPAIITYPQGTFFSDSAQARAMLTGAPPDFVAFAGREAERLSSYGEDNCADAAHGVGVDQIRTDGWALGSVNDCGGKIVLWKRGPDGWSEVLGTQEPWSCSDLRRLGIGQDFAGPCLSN